MIVENYNLNLKKMARKTHYFNTQDSYIVYKCLSENPIDIKEYCKINHEFIKFLVEELFEHGEIQIPERLGRIQILGKKIKVKYEDGIIKGVAPNWVETKKLWEKDEEARKNKQLVFHFNEQTDGIRYKFYWNKSRVLVSNKTLFRLRMSRANKRRLASLIKSGKEYLIT